MSGFEVAVAQRVTLPEGPLTHPRVEGSRPCEVEQGKGELSEWVDVQVDAVVLRAELANPLEALGTRASPPVFFQLLGDESLVFEPGYYLEQEAASVLTVGPRDEYV